jgi:hypothetical protein
MVVGYPDGATSQMSWAAPSYDTTSANRVVRVAGCCNGYVRGNSLGSVNSLPCRAMLLFD